MSSLESSLPENWVERIFAAMRATYGATFDRQWECPAGADVVKHMQAMKAHWGRELRVFQQNPKAISYALENLPEYPPNLVQFKSLCFERPESEPVQFKLPAPVPKADKARVEQVMAAVPKLMQLRDPKAWAWALKAKEERDPKALTLAQRTMWRAALAVELSQRHDEEAAS